VRALLRASRWLIGLLALLAAAAAPAAAEGAAAACRLDGVEHPALCGTLQRPLDPAAPGGRSITLHYAVLPALSRHKRPDAVFFFAGGPGQSAIVAGRSGGPAAGRFSNRRDIVLIDQRGTGRSAPLRLRRRRRAAAPAARIGRPGRGAAGAATLPPGAAASLPHGDLRQYTTASRRRTPTPCGRRWAWRASTWSARRMARGGAGLPAAAPADGAPRGARRRGAARHGAAAIRLRGRRPGGAGRLAAWCDADPGCSRQHPRLRQTWQRLLASLPREVTVTHPLTGVDETLHLTPAMLAGLLRAPLYAPALASALPAALQAAADGAGRRWPGWQWRWAAARAAAVAQGMHFSVVCAEDMPLLERSPAPPAGDFGAA
jgi:hypothetical protein